MKFESSMLGFLLITTILSCGGKKVIDANNECSYEDPCQDGYLCVARSDGSRKGDCRALCSQDTDCADGYSCTEVDDNKMACVPTSELYEHLADDCTADSDCLQGWCVQYNDGYTCAKKCTDNSDCIGNTVCKGTQDTEGNILKACLP